MDFMDQIREDLDRGGAEVETRHDVEAVIVCCGDARLFGALYDLVVEEAGHDTGHMEYDLGATPPGGLWVFSNDAPLDEKEVRAQAVKTYARLHDTDIVILGIHEDCGKLKAEYGFDPKTEEGREVQESAIERISAEAFIYWSNQRGEQGRSFKPRIIRFNATGVMDEKTRKMTFKPEDITEKVRRFAEVGER